MARIRFHLRMGGKISEEMGAIPILEVPVENESSESGTIKASTITEEQKDIRPVQEIQESSNERLSNSVKLSALSEHGQSTPKIGLRP